MQVNYFAPTDLSHLDSQPGTLMSVESANSDASKLRVKIKVNIFISRFQSLSRMTFFLPLTLTLFLIPGLLCSSSPLRMHTADTSGIGNSLPGPPPLHKPRTVRVNFHLPCDCYYLL